MKSSCTLLLSLCAGISMNSAYAATVATFEGAVTDTPVNLQQFGGGSGPVISPTGGNPGGYLQITSAANDKHNWATFDRSDAGTFSRSTFSFDFRIAIGTVPSADGFSFSYADTAIHGVSGNIVAAPFTAEDPAAAGILGFGFDTWSNQGVHDNPNVPTGSDYQEISVFWNGAVVQRIDDTRLLETPLLLDDGAWHHVDGAVDFDAALVTLNVDGNEIFTDVAIPGLTPFESRIMFAARTGGENEDAGIDNLNVLFVPEPSVSLLAGLLGLGGLLFWRRRKN
jgi:MYXO-CTERM domain-containing protein